MRKLIVSEFVTLGVVMQASGGRTRIAMEGSSTAEEEEESVKVKCFGCDALIEADDSDAVVRGPRAGEPHLVIPGRSSPELRPRMCRLNRSPCAQR